MVAVNQQEIRSAPVAVRAPAVVPPKQAVLGAGAATNFHPPAALQSRAVVAKTTPPPPPTSFAVRQAAIEKNQGQPLSMAQTRQLQTAQTHAAVAPVRIAPPAKPATATYNSQGGGNKGNAAPVPQNPNRPSNVGQTNTQVNPANRPSYTPTNTHGFSDRPPSAQPAPSVNTQLEQKHQQEIQQLQQKHDQQYQKLQQKQIQEQQKLQQQNANAERQQQIQQQHQQQLEQLQQKQQQQQQALRQKQEAEHAKAYKPQPKEQPKEDRPHR
jgi:hypothetical protein